MELVVKINSKSIQILFKVNVAIVFPSAELELKSTHQLSKYNVYNCYKSLNYFSSNYDQSGEKVDTEQQQRTDYSL